MNEYRKGVTGPKPLEPFRSADGRLYLPQPMIEKMYCISDSELRAHRKNGLPFLIINRHVYFNEDDFHLYFSGEIGKPDGRKTRWKRAKQEQSNAETA